MKHFLWTTGLLIIQILILNHIQIYGFGTPFACIYPILLFSLETPRWKILLLGFIIGSIEDIFINTPGVAAASFTALGMIQPILLKAVSPRDDDEKKLPPSARTLGWSNYIKYTLITSLIVSFLFYTLETFSFFNYTKYLISIGSTWLSTFIFLLAIERVKNAKI